MPNYPDRRSLSPNPGPVAFGVGRSTPSMIKVVRFLESWRALAGSLSLAWDPRLVVRFDRVSGLWLAHRSLSGRRSERLS